MSADDLLRTTNIAAKRLYLFLAFLAVVPAVAQGRRSVPSLPDNIERVSQAIVRVQATFEFKVDGSGETFKWMSSGTGFVVDHNVRIVTADHVVDSAMNESKLKELLANQKKTETPGSFKLSELVASIQTNNHRPEDDPNGRGSTTYNNTVATPATVLRADATLDVAILQGSRLLLSGIPLGGPFGTLRLTIPEFQTASPRAGDAVSVTGFPAVQGLEMGIPGLTTNTGIISNTYFKTNQNANNSYFVADMHVNHGDSGGPVYNNSDGKVIGFMDAYLSATNGENSGLSLIVPIRDLQRLLVP